MLALSNFLGLSKPVICENGGVVAASPSEMMLLTDKGESLRAYDLLSRRIDGVKLKQVFPRLTEVVLLCSFDVRVGQHILDENSVPVRINDSGYAYHLNHKSVDKGKGLKLAVEQLNIPLSQTISIGDSITDESMFKLCGYSIAVANAPQSIKKKVNYVTEKINGEGVAEAVQHISRTLLSNKI
jgi:phosphoglycolate phosphatase (TIGR01487 family)